jgi:uncharacterized 2Fe-2S/4Fe-4S cluster protein (DUF4445 family)
MGLTIKTAQGNHMVSPCAGFSITTLFESTELALNTRCAEKGSCRGCTVYLEEGTFEVNGQEITLDGSQRQEALGCQTKILSKEATLFTPGTSLIETSGQIDDECLIPEFDLAPQVLSYNIELSPSSLKDQFSDTERLLQAITSVSGLTDIDFSLTQLKILGQLIPKTNCIQVVINKTDSGWTVTSLNESKVGEETTTYAVAIDIGTTTVVAALLDTVTGKVLRRAARYNGQIDRADDVASRIIYCDQDEEKLKELQDLVIRHTINPLIKELCRVEKIAQKSIYRVCLSGNTIMTHLALGVSPEGMGKVPFHPVCKNFPLIKAKSLGLTANPEAIVETVPAIAGYVGGDITSDLYIISKEHHREKRIVLVDIGTNGEIVLITPDGMLACATAAGPAFEGHGIMHGCRAASGAIESVRLCDPLDFKLGVIGKSLPIGICGTGIIDFIAEGFHHGLINSTGRYDLEQLKDNDRYEALALFGTTVNACVLVKGEETESGAPILVSEADIAQVMKAKGAIFAGVKTLLDESGLGFDQIDQLVLAGGFAKYLNIQNAIGLGLLPDLPHEKFHIIGNGSLAGACLHLLEESTSKACLKLAQKPKILELNLANNFQDNYIDAMLIPNLDEELFPSVFEKH